PTALDSPQQGEFAIEQGGALTPEFLSVLLGLSAYTAAFIAEVVRSGIGSVALGQSEAAAALGLNQRQAMRLVRLPQAMRVIIPPMTNQYLNLTKNSSLAVAIGYPDVVSIANTALNQTGRAVECIAIVMLVYLTTSLATSLLMSWYNTKMAIAER
ncbi:MAG: ABC transporter permease subunit, partial [Burkholderiaceae bacterium]